VPLRLDAGELLRHEVLHLDGVAEIGLFRFESDGSLQWLGVQREWERASVRLAVATTRWQGRAWFLCPACGRRSGRVFDPDGSGAWRCRRLCAAHLPQLPPEPAVPPDARPRPEAAAGAGDPHGAGRAGATVRGGCNGVAREAGDAGASRPFWTRRVTSDGDG